MVCKRLGSGADTIGKLLLYQCTLFFFTCCLVLEETRSAHKAEIDSLKKSHSSELQKRDENLKKYQEVIKQIEQEYAERREALSAAKKKQVKDIVDKHGDDPQKLAELVRDSFGFEIHVGEDDE